MYHFVVLYLVLILGAPCDAKKGPAKNVRATIATDIPCLDTPQCLSIVGDAWCQSGLVCVSGFCHRVPDAPCHAQTQTCDEANRKCISKSCLASEDCNDGLFCNGHEKCVNQTCEIDPKSKPPCKHGLCNETERKCMRPVRLAHWRNYASNEAFMASNTTPAIIGEAESRIMTGSIIGFIVIIIMFALIFLMIALVNRNYTPIPTSDAYWTY